jgi:hypothetical protein
MVNRTLAAMSTNSGESTTTPSDATKKSIARFIEVRR